MSSFECLRDKIADRDSSQETSQADAGGIAFFKEGHWEEEESRRGHLEGVRYPLIYGNDWRDGLATG